MTHIGDSLYSDVLRPGSFLAPHLSALLAVGHKLKVAAREQEDDEDEDDGEGDEDIKVRVSWPRGF